MLFSRRAYVILCWAFVALLPVQVLLAGSGIMGGDIEIHEMFGMLVLGTVIPLLLVVLALLGRMPKFAGWAALLLVVLHLMPALPSADNEWIAGLHPVIAFLSWPYVYFVMLRRAQAKVDEAGDAGSGTVAA